MNKVIVDTSAWIDFFRAPAGGIGDEVATLIEQDRAVLVGPVLAELLQGLKSRREADTLNELFSILPYLETTRDDWENAGDLLRRMRHNGITMPLSDTLIASIAKKHGHAVLTLDKHFEHLEIPLHPARN
ncbi:type II toxin-antitoxin system VapC family toxin [Geoalkalibacter sp.]|uniref:type II toxin-antitoxin system VapC family toxin n=1 Tax=Geoalkalibacter sp. TaxID=3041440 RepID=UPI00272DFA51|nr:PIN domain-containing protein [Geoalkalibacter sp.]